MQDVDDLDDLELRVHAIEDQVVSVHTAPHSAIFIARHERISPRHVGKLTAVVNECLNEGVRSRRRLLADVLSNLEQIELGGGGDDNLHPAYSFAPNRSRSSFLTSSMLCARPASASAIPRAIDSSSTASRR
jgi:hypothetical protein